MNESQFKTRRELILELQTKVEGLLSANTMIQGALVKTHRIMEDRIDELSKTIQELTYLNKALLNTGSFDEAAVNTKADEYKLEDFEKYSNKENETGGFVATMGEAKASSVVVVGTQCPDKKDREIFRARLLIEKIEDESLKNAFIGKKAGDSFEHKIRGVNQKVVVFSVFDKKEEEAVTNEQAPVAS